MKSPFEYLSIFLLVSSHLLKLDASTIDDDLPSFLQSLQSKVSRGGGVGGSSGGGGDDEVRSITTMLPKLGRVKGRRSEGMDFFGNIPFAAPPVGNLRFAPPEPVPPWAPAILDATNYGSDCWQVRDFHNKATNTMSEDCLTLNIFTPAGQISRKKLLPVMVWLHGGAFQQGGSNRPEYQGKALVERDLIVVSVNYRLGALGFLVSSSDGLYGNFGLMDQRAALDFISINIEHFGGDPNQVTLFGESAGAVMIGLHLMMEGVGKLFQKAIMQSFPMGYTFRTPTVADFIGEAFKRSVDCRDVGCLRTERVEDLIKVQSGLMGIPRSVGDFFTWSPTLTQQTQVTIGPQGVIQTPFRTSQYVFRHQPINSQKWASVNVSQPLSHLDLVPTNIPIIIGSNKHEGEIFVYNAFPAPMPKAVYWMFVGALFRDSASRVLKHYRPYVAQVELEADQLAQRQIEEEENKHFYMEHQDQLEREYETLLAMNATRKAQRRYLEAQALVDTWSRGGGMLNFTKRQVEAANRLFPKKISPEEAIERERMREEKRKKQRRLKALKEAAKVVVDYRPVMSRIIDDYLFRCPTWHYAHTISGLRRKHKKEKNVFVYRFSQPTHIPGYKECWGKSCHTSELAYVFQAMPVIRSDYSTLGPIAQAEAPSAPEYPYTDILAAYQGAVEAYISEDWTSDTVNNPSPQGNYTYAFQRILSHFFGDYFKEDADEEIASDMSERWAAFAKTGDPNYEGSKAIWLPWRYQQQRPGADTSLSSDDIGNLFENYEDDWSEDELDSGGEKIIWADSKAERAYRRRALTALGYEIAEEDVYRTELMRSANKFHENEIDKAFLTSRFLFRTSLRIDHDQGLRDADAQEILHIAQEMGVMGIGLAGERPYSEWNEDFFPEILELKWPPESRLLERDCTCDMWDRIRCKCCISLSYVNVSHLLTIF
jgi:carboxylesterase type B